MTNLLDRKSIRKYDPNVKISETEMIEIINKASRAPSSMNMQPWRFFIIESKEAKEKLRPILYGNQLQLDTSSAMILISTPINKFDDAEKIYNLAVLNGLMPEDVRDKQLRNITNMVPNLKPDAVLRDNFYDCGLVSMQLMHIAREHGYDTCPIGGFKKDKINEALGIDSSKFYPVMLLSIGKADEQGYPSIRLDAKDTSFWL